MLPFRPRPIVHPDAVLNTPRGKFEPALSDWSSFPSDHAVMFFSIAVAFAWISKPASVLLVIHAFAVVSLPRVYLGLHWPSDIVAGAFLGAVLAVAFMPVAIALTDRLSVGRLLKQWQALVMPAIVLMTVEVATMFSASRWLLSSVAKALALA